MGWGVLMTCLMHAELILTRADDELNISLALAPGWL
jgi:hypothetical protein